MQLIEEGKLSLETKLSTFYLDIRNAESITVKQLLSHRTGIQSFTDEPAYVNYMTTLKSQIFLPNLWCCRPRQWAGP